MGKNAEQKNTGNSFTNVHIQKKSGHKKKKKKKVGAEERRTKPAPRGKRSLVGVGDLGGGNNGKSRPVRDRQFSFPGATRGGLKQVGGEGLK